MTHAVDILDPATGEWITKAEGEKARPLVEPFRLLIDTHAIVEFKGVINETGEVIKLVSAVLDPGELNQQEEGRRVVLARVRPLTP